MTIQMTKVNYQGSTTVRVMQHDAQDYSATVILRSHPDRSSIALAVCQRKAEMNDLAFGAKHSQHI